MECHNGGAEPHDQPRDLSQIYDEARRLAAGKARQSYLDIQQLSPTDRELVERLLAVEVDATAGTGWALALADLPDDAEIQRVWRLFEGSQLGPYRVGPLIGHGGHGLVFAASTDDSPVPRWAVKILKPGLDTTQVLARFRRESETLRLLNHRNIATFVDAGETADGRPYFVMELILGSCLTDHGDRYRLTVDARLRLFLAVCQAIQHSHQKGVIHRDIKPRNILVAGTAERPVVKVVDFGIAKSLDQPDDQLTQTGQPLGTRLYMSPEHQRGGLGAADALSDVYSLGVVLYELLAGRPLSSGQLQDWALQPLAGAPQVADFEPPSRALARSSEAEQLAELRGTTLRPLIAQLRNDLDNIVLKATELDPQLRYESVAALAQDLERYLTCQPVLASKPNWRYRIMKWSVRYRRSLQVALSLGVILGSLTLVSFYWQHRVARAESAVKLQTQEIQRVESVAERESAVSRQLASFLCDHLLGPHQEGRFNPDVTFLERVRGAVRQIETTFPDSPIMQAQVLEATARGMLSVGAFRDAVEHLERCHRLRLAELGPENPATVRAVQQLGEALCSAGDYERAERMLTAALPHATRVWGADDTLTLDLASSAAWARLGLGRPEQARDLLQQSYESRLKKHGPQATETLMAQTRYARVLKDLGEYQQALELSRGIWERHSEQLGPHHAVTLEAGRWLATMYQDVEQYSTAESIYWEVIAGMRQALGSEHPSTLACLNHLASLYGTLGRLVEAEGILVEICQVQQRSAGEAHPNTVSSRFNLAVIYQAQGKLTASERELQHLIERQRATCGRYHTSTLRYRGQLASVWEQQGRYWESHQLYWTTLLEQLIVNGRRHPHFLHTFAGLRRLYARVGRPAVFASLAPRRTPSSSSLSEVDLPQTSASPLTGKQP